MPRTKDLRCHTLVTTPLSKKQKLVLRRDQKKKRNTKNTHSTRPTYSGYTKKETQLEWTHFKLGSVNCYRHPIHNYVLYDDIQPLPVTKYTWESTATPADIKAVMYQKMRHPEIET